MTVLEKYLNQTVEYKRRISNNDYAEYQYDPPTKIKARKEQTHKIIERSDGSILKAQDFIILVQEVFEGDLLDDKEILSVSALVWNNGSIIGWEAYT